MIELFVPAMGLSGPLPQFVSSMDNLFFGWVFHIFLSTLEARPGPTSRSMPPDIFLFDENFIYIRLINARRPHLIAATELTSPARAT
jgi:hypothetical protein